MQNRAKTTALAVSILQSFCLHQPRKRGLLDAMLSFRDNLFDANPAIIRNAPLPDRNSPVFCWGMYVLNTIIDDVTDVKRGKKVRGMFIETILTEPDNEEVKNWPEMFLDVINGWNHDRWGIEPYQIDSLVWMLEFIRDNRPQ